VRWAWLFAVAAACRVDVSLDGDFRCDDGVSCPRGLICRAAQCVPPASDADAPSPDGEDAPAAGADGLPDALALGPFGEPTAILEVNSPQNDDDPTLTGDLLEIYFESTRPPTAGGGDIWRATRSSVDEVFGAPAIVAELSSAAQDGTPEVTPDGLTLYLHSDRVGGQNDIYVSTRATRADPWSTPVPVAELNSAASEGAPVVTGEAAYFSSDRPGGTGGIDLYRAARPDPSKPFGPALEIEAANSADAESEPWADVSETLLYFTSNRPGGSGLGDLWLATRASPSERFGAPIPVSELATGEQDADAWLSPDLRTIVFSRTSGGQADILMATR
jgi:hypothetical protein